MHPLETTHSASSCVPATPSAIYDALLDPQALAQWLAPDGATCRIDRFEPWVGGRFRMVLSFAAQPGKSGAFTDEVNGHFVELQPGARVVQAITFESADAAFGGVMTMTWQLAAEGVGTRVTIVAENVPRGISRQDHEQGFASTLANLAGFFGSSGGAPQAGA